MDIVVVMLAQAATTARRAARVLVFSAVHAPTSSETASRLSAQTSRPGGLSATPPDDR